MTYYVIYIPGLGDTRVSGQRLALRTWRFWGVKPHLFQMKWADDLPYQTKFERLLNLVDQLSAKGTVSIVCASAGATVALNAFAERQDVINGVVCIAGKINNTGAISKYFERRTPSFWESAHQTTSALPKLTDQARARILSIRGMVDLRVPARDSLLKGAVNRITWTSGHALTIGTQLVFGAPSFLRFLKLLSKQL